MFNIGCDEIINILDNHPGADKVSVVVYSTLSTDEQVKKSSWGRLLGSEKKKTIRKADAPLHIIEKFDSKSFIDKMRNFL